MENLGEFIINHWILVTAFVVLAALVFSDVITRRLSGVPALGANQAVRLVNQQKGKFIDVREPDEFNKEHIADSVAMPLGTLKQDSAQLKDKTKPVVVVCASGQRARNGAKQLRAEGFEQVYVLSGGLHAWKEAKLPVFSNQ
jgi:rhodanese-related sulfurtransferase